ncbi:hypothetical protein BC829DRAFT_443422 [Chytridium lagenaria]|nr:hypothetical protein BC829DRAFT_443422 [Chytridium lagenaria]
MFLLVKDGEMDAASRLQKVKAEDNVMLWRVTALDDVAALLMNGDRAGACKLRLMRALGSCFDISGQIDKASYFDVSPNLLEQNYHLPSSDTWIFPISGIDDGARVTLLGIDFGLTLANGIGAAGALPHLQAYKLTYAWWLADYGFIDLANRYCDSVEHVLKSYAKGSPYFHRTFVGVLRDLCERLATVQSKASTESKESGGCQSMQIESTSTGMYNSADAPVFPSMTRPSSTPAAVLRLHGGQQYQDNAYQGDMYNYTNVTLATTRMGTNMRQMQESISINAVYDTNGVAGAYDPNGASTGHENVNQYGAYGSQEGVYSSQDGGYSSQQDGVYSSQDGGTLQQDGIYSKKDGGFSQREGHYSSQDAVFSQHGTDNGAYGSTDAISAQQIVSQKLFELCMSYGDNASSNFDAHQQDSFGTINNHGNVGSASRELNEDFDDDLASTARSSGIFSFIPTIPFFGGKKDDKGQSGNATKKNEGKALKADLGEKLQLVYDPVLKKYVNPNNVGKGVAEEHQRRFHRTYGDQLECTWKQAPISHSSYEAPQDSPNRPSSAAPATDRSVSQPGSLTASPLAGNFGNVAAEELAWVLQLVVVLEIDMSIS